MMMSRNRRMPALVLVACLLMTRAPGCSRPTTVLDPGSGPSGGGTAVGGAPGGIFGSNVGGWAYFSFGPGQKFTYECSSARGLSGWVSLSVASGEAGKLAVTCEGKWGLGEFSETAALAPGMTPLEFTLMLDLPAYSAMNSLLSIEGVPFEEVMWEEGFEWESGAKSIAVTGTETYAGVTGLVVTYTYEHPFTREVQSKTY